MAHWEHVGLLFKSTTTYEEIICKIQYISFDEFAQYVVFK